MSSEKAKNVEQNVDCKKKDEWDMHAAKFGLRLEHDDATHTWVALKQTKAAVGATRQQALANALAGQQERAVHMALYD